MSSSKPRVGAVYWLPDCRPPGPTWTDKDRYLVVAISKDGGQCLVVPFSASSKNKDGLDVPIQVPPKQSNKTGLPKNCAAVVGSAFPIPSEKLTDKRGYLPAKPMESILANLAKAAGTQK